MVATIKQTICPVKYCFFIKPNSEEIFYRVCEIAYSLWGGIFSPIISFYNNFSEDERKLLDVAIEYDSYYKNIIANFDPDIIIYDDTLDENKISYFAEEREIISLTTFEKKLIDDTLNYGISIIHIINHLVNSEFKFLRSDNKKISIPTFSSTDKFVKIYKGIIHPKIVAEIESLLSGKSFYHIGSMDYTDTVAAKNKDIIDVLKINTFKIKSIAQTNWKKVEGIYIFDINNLEGSIFYWNTRALGWNIIPIPVSLLEEDHIKNTLSNFFTIQKYGGNAVVRCIIDPTIGDKKDFIENYLNNTFDPVNNKIFINYQCYYPAFWESFDVLEKQQTICSNHYIESFFDQTKLDKDIVQFETKELPFGITKNYDSIGSFKINFEISYDKNFIDNAGIISNIKAEDWYKLTKSNGHWRISQNGMNLYVSTRKDLISFKIPLSENFFKIYFSRKGYNMTKTSNGKLADEVFKNIGGLDGVSIFSNLSILNVLQLFEDNNSVEFPTLLSKIKKETLQNKNENATRIIGQLVNNKIIEIGAFIQCPICHQRSFYLPDSLGTKLYCNACRNRYDLPAHNPNEIKWSYRGIGAFSKNNKVGGVITVFLCLKLFSNEFTYSLESFSSLIGLELSNIKTKLKEVDLAILLKSHRIGKRELLLFLFECKTFKRFTEDDFLRMKELGDQFPNSILVFATLNQELSTEEKNGIRKLYAYFQGPDSKDVPRNLILVITGKELFFKNKESYLEEFKSSTFYFESSDRVNQFCNWSFDKYLK